MKKYKCIIIDDETYAVEGLKKYINQMPQLLIVKEYTDPLTALLELASHEVVDLILMDINMPQITGIELSKEIRQKTKKLVFTTAYSQYGYQAFEVEADAYLLKPYTLTKFAATIRRLFPEQNNAKRRNLDYSAATIRRLFPEQNVSKAETHDFFLPKIKMNS